MERLHFVIFAQARPDTLTLVFDQSIDRRYPSRDQIEAKLAWLAERGVHGVTYESHPCFVLVSATKAVLERAIETLLQESRLPVGRLARISNRRRTRRCSQPLKSAAAEAQNRWADTASVEESFAP